MISVEKSIAIETAKEHAYAAATERSGSGATYLLIRAAEVEVMRRLLARLLPEGEVEYWRQVEWQVRK